jgi:hypothetical protein
VHTRLSTACSMWQNNQQIYNSKAVYISRATHGPLLTQVIQVQVQLL